MLIGGAEAKHKIQWNPGIWHTDKYKSCDFVMKNCTTYTHTHIHTKGLHGTSFIIAELGFKKWSISLDEIWRIRMKFTKPWEVFSSDKCARDWPCCSKTVSQQVSDILYTNWLFNACIHSSDERPDGDDTIYLLYNRRQWELLCKFRWGLFNSGHYCHILRWSRGHSWWDLAKCSTFCRRNV